MVHNNAVYNGEQTGLRSPRRKPLYPEALGADKRGRNVIPSGHKHISAGRRYSFEHSGFTNFSLSLGMANSFAVVLGVLDSPSCFETESLSFGDQELERRVLERTSQLTETNRHLAKQNQELVRASRVKTEFLARMSHEFRTPLNSIIGFTDLLAEQGEGVLGEAYAGYVHYVSEGASHLLALVNDILDLFRTEAGRMDLRHDEFSATEAIADVLCVIGPLAEAKSIELRSNASHTFVVHGDRTRFKQILYNLLSNALKFTPDHGHIQVSAEADCDSIRFRVADTGVGIPREHQTVIFDEFVQVALPADGVREGAGLGLAITKRIVELHGGRIWVESTLGQGSHFFFTMPAARGSKPQSKAARPLRRKSSRATSRTTNEQACDKNQYATHQHL